MDLTSNDDTCKTSNRLNDGKNSKNSFTGASKSTI